MYLITKIVEFVWPSLICMVNGHDYEEMDNTLGKIRLVCQRCDNELVA